MIILDSGVAFFKQRIPVESFKNISTKRLKPKCSLIDLGEIVEK